MSPVAMLVVGVCIGFVLGLAAAALEKKYGSR